MKFVLMKTPQHLKLHILMYMYVLLYRCLYHISGSIIQAALLYNTALSAGLIHKVP